MTAMFKSFMQNLERISFDLFGAVLILFGALYITPYQFIDSDAKDYLVQLIITKFVLVSLGNVHFLITRKLMFPYINFKEEKDLTNNLMIIIMYLVIVLSWARGG